MNTPSRFLSLSALALAAAASVTLLLASCGGGGGNPGTCTGSAQVCDGGTSGDAAGVTSTPSTTATTSTTADTASCTQFATQADAQQYFFEHTAPQLDPDGDGIACNN